MKQDKLPYFDSLEEAQKYLDKLYSLPLYHLAKPFKSKPNLKLVVDNTK